jgi:hypothetical protein
MTRRRILVVWSGPETGTSANLFKALSKLLSERHEVREGPNDTVTGSKARRRLHMIKREVYRWPLLLRSDTIILHSYVALAFPSVILAWLLRRRIVVMHWDVYPITINGQRLGGDGRAFFDRIEQICVHMATRVVLPTEDFLPFVEHSDFRYLPLWPSLPSTVVNRSAREPAEPIRLAFVGQTNLTRGLPETITRLKQEAHAQFELHIFSANPPDLEWATLAPNVRVINRAYLAREELTTALAEMDFGLISLHPGLGQPGFPSKVFDYVAAGLPVVYSGRSLPAFEALLERTGVGISLGESSVDWLSAREKAASGILQAARAFELETCLTHESIERAFF